MILHSKLEIMISLEWASYCLVCFAINILDSIDSSWYTGRVFVGLNEAIFEPSSPSQPIAELCEIVLPKNLEVNPIMFIYKDVGPDHRLTYLKVQLSLISLFLKLDLDSLCVCRTAAYHSWHNPVERMMSILNLGFQSISLMRNKQRKILNRSFWSVTTWNRWEQQLKRSQHW